MCVVDLCACFVCPWFLLSVCLSVCLSCLSACLSVYLSIRPSVHLSLYLAVLDSLCLPYSCVYASRCLLSVSVVRVFCVSVCMSVRDSVQEQGSSYFSLREAVPHSARSHSGSMDVLDVIAAPRL